MKIQSIDSIKGLVEISGCMNENPSKEEECVVQMGVNGEKKCSDDGKEREGEKGKIKDQS